MCSLIALFAAACGDDASSVDGAVLDAGMDGGRDAGLRVDGWPDAARDSGRRDAGLDAGAWWEAAGWEPLPALPTGCVIERARRPEMIYHAEWVSCGDGCERLSPETNVAIDDEGAWHDGTRGYFAAITYDPADRRIVLLATTEGTALGAWRAPPDMPGDGAVCLVNDPTAGDDYAAVGVDGLTAAGDRSWALLHGPIADLTTISEYAAVLDGSSWLPGSSVMQDMGVSATTVGAELQPTRVVRVFEDGRVATLGRTPEIRGSAHLVQVIGRDVFFNEYGATWCAVHGTLDEPASVFYEVPSVDVILFLTDGVSFAWLQGYDPVVTGSYSRVELWTAPYTSDPAALAPRLVPEMEGYTQMSMGGGYIALRRTSTPPQRIEVYSLTDGVRRKFIAPAGATINDIPLYVAEHEMLVLGSFDRRETLFRVQSDSLPIDGG